mmetsp:Transcript_62417/g.131928  ORF Transcript_62417/g.131928 Transcript_62417/m.131928 type:complete len:250 (-) Transcript_62417:355-1104(-)
MSAKSSATSFSPPSSSSPPSRPSLSTSSAGLLSRPTPSPSPSRLRDILLAPAAAASAPSARDLGVPLWERLLALGRSILSFNTSNSNFSASNLAKKCSASLAVLRRSASLTSTCCLSTSKARLASSTPLLTARERVGLASWLPPGSGEPLPSSRGTVASRSSASSSSKRSSASFCSCCRQCCSALERATSWRGDEPLPSVPLNRAGEAGNRRAEVEEVEGVLGSSGNPPPVARARADAAEALLGERYWP